MKLLKVTALFSIAALQASEAEQAFKLYLINRTNSEATFKMRDDSRHSVEPRSYKEVSFLYGYQAHVVANIDGDVKDFGNDADIAREWNDAVLQEFTLIYKDARHGTVSGKKLCYFKSFSADDWARALQAALRDLKKNN